MPSNLKRQELLTKVRNAVTAEFKATGQVLRSKLTDEICESEKDTIIEIGVELAKRSVSDMILGQINSWTTLSMAGEAQLALPGIPVDIASELPPTITVRLSGEETRHVAISHATVGEMRAYEAMLAEQIKKDQRKHKAVRYVVSKCTEEHDDTLITAVFTTEKVAI